MKVASQECPYFVAKEFWEPEMREREMSTNSFEIIKPTDIIIKKK